MAERLKVVMEMVRCMDEKPKVDGSYIVARMHNDVFSIVDAEYGYTVDGGWNTHWEDGVLQKACRTFLEQCDDYWWAKETIVKGGESNE